MKVSKKLLNSILVGVAVGAVSSCTLLEDVWGNDEDRTEQRCDRDKKDSKKYDCPGCGMG